MHLAFTYIGLKMHCFEATACYFCNFPNVNHTVVFSNDILPCTLQALIFTSTDTDLWLESDQIIKVQMQQSN